MEILKFGKEFESKFVTLVKEGRYEGLITNAVRTKGKDGNGKERIEITLKFRDDVEQENKGDLISYRIFPIDGDTAFNYKKINNIICTQVGLPTFKPEFITVDEIIQYLNGLYVSFEIENSFEDYFGEDRSRVKDYRFGAPVSLPEKSQATPTVAPTPAPKANIPDDDDFPF